MPTRRELLSGAAAMLAACPAQAQDAGWPSRPIRILIPTAPGGSPDIASRLLGDKITPRLGQPFVVESQTTAGGVAGLQIVAKTPDSHTFAMLTGGFATQAATLKNLPYEPLKDFAFITSVVRYPIVYAVAPESPIKSFKDMVERARANPNKVSYGIVGAGTVYHLLGKWIDNAGGIELDQQHGARVGQLLLLVDEGIDRALGVAANRGHAAGTVADKSDVRCVHVNHGALLVSVEFGRQFAGPRSETGLPSVLKRAPS